MKKLPLFEAVALLVGTVVGAGFLGIPYVVSKVGFWPGLILIAVIGTLILLQFLMTAEITLRTKEKHQIPGYVTKYLGRDWRVIIDTLVIFSAYGGLLAYLVGEGRVLSAIFGGSPLLYSLGFFLVMAFIVFHNLKLIEEIDLVLTLIMATVVIAVAFASWSAIRLENFPRADFDGLLPAYGVILFSFLGVAAVPEMRMGLRGKEKLLPKAVIIGTLIPMAIYLLFTAAVLGVTGLDTTEVATVGLGEKLGREIVVVGNLLAVITMSTAFLGLSFSLKETFWYDLKFNRVTAWLLTLSVPLALLFLNLVDFIEILLVVGAVFGGLQGIILALTARKAAVLGDRKPEFVLAAKPVIGTILILVFALGIIYTLFGLRT